MTKQEYDDLVRQYEACEDGSKMPVSDEERVFLSIHVANKALTRHVNALERAVEHLEAQAADSRIKGLERRLAAVEAVAHSQGMFEFDAPARPRNDVAMLENLRVEQERTERLSR